jgi:hypothetical protein
MAKDSKLPELYEELSKSEHLPADYLWYEAESAFFHVRWKRTLGGIRKRIRGGSHSMSARPAPLRGEKKESLVAINLDAIVGFIDGRSERLGPLPSLGRRYHDAWMRAYYTLDLDEYLPLSAVRAEGGWLIKGDTSALILIELLRYRERAEVLIADRGTAPSRLEAGPTELPIRLTCCDEEIESRLTYSSCRAAKG